jgi:hypothetical protein
MSAGSVMLPFVYTRCLHHNKHNQEEEMEKHKHKVQQQAEERACMK